ncbi:MULTISPECIES: hypothetical protein [unclassified Pseudoalteromonas]|uniref:hypothetical protein n=1 Tax=unclassified Pseudoalteromonas TaxID=194690 RepID=UPI000F74E8CC|nr:MULTISPECIES: hypothetical protein [unclassified Pseudoalteromonas]AZN34771.1 hypothetical protein EJ103_18945 [Pseudoalteromonas sp. Xi13]MDC9502336.1 hypothetical protein [Pseudoalteromonas sp. Angola-18]MDC9509078.1 hypothetical protein [Pseudoalteromonas sp. Angola-4]MDC9527993.1 hypothetical protein [Pseudoalteromonas sp. Angola-7]
MNIKDEALMDIAQLFLRCSDLIDYEWKEVTFVFEFGEGCTSNSGFLYDGEEITPAAASIEDEQLLLDNTLEQLREDIYQQCGEKFNQLLFQMENETKRFKVDFEFDNPNRWAITPSNMFEMREKLRPKFD